MRKSIDQRRSSSVRERQGGGGAQRPPRVRPEVPVETDERVFLNRQDAKREEADRRTDKEPEPVQRPSNSSTHTALVTQMDKHKGDRRLVRRDRCVHLFPVSPPSPCALSWRVFKTYTL